MKKIILVFTVIISIFSSCQKLKEPGDTSAVKIANEWWVTFSQGGTDLLGTYVKIATYNTAANDNQIWIDDLEKTYQFKIKATYDYNSLTFTANAAQNEYYNITVNLTDGKVLKNMGRSKSGNVVDSVHMNLEFSDDPGTIYELSGHERTRFTEDDY